MASISRDGPKGGWRIQLALADGRRVTIRLGPVDKRTALSIKTHVEHLAAARAAGAPLPLETAGWLSRLDGKLRDRLAKCGLTDDKPATPLGKFLNDWLESRKADYKPGSISVWQQAIRDATAFLGAATPLTGVTAAKAEDIRRAMIERRLRPATIHKRLQILRTIFAHARRQGLIESNPFEFVRHRLGDPSERRAYVPVEHVMKVIEHAPDATWRLLIALARFGGLRTPSESFSLRWSDVDWAESRLTVPSPKTEHRAGRGYRVVPLFPELLPYLQEAWESAPEGAEFIFPESVRQRAQGPNGWRNCNLRTQLERLVRRAGLEPWPRLWHSLRASCESDLVRRFPLPVAAKWLGNTATVAMRHYVDVTDADYRRAIQGVEKTDAKSDVTATQNPTRRLAAGYGGICGTSPESTAGTEVTANHAECRPMPPTG